MSYNITMREAIEQDAAQAFGVDVYADPCGLFAVIAGGARELAKRLGLSSEIALPARSGGACALSVPPGRGVDEAELALALRNMPKHDGISIFESASLKGNRLILTVDEQLPDEYARRVLSRFEPSVPDGFMLPVSGAAIGERIAGYARARLLMRARCCEWRRTDASRDALLRCIGLFCENESGKRLFASAVRASLRACDEGSAGGERARAMAAALELYELRRQING